MEFYGPFGLCRRFPFSLSLVAEIKASDQRIKKNPGTVGKSSDQRFKNHTLESCKNYWESFKGSPDQFWAIVLNDSKNTHIGNLTITIDESHNTADIGILIGEQSIWGKGFGLEAWKAMCNYLLMDKKIRKVTAGTIEENIAMLKIMQKSNMKEDGRRKGHNLFENKEVDIVYAALFNEDL